MLSVVQSESEATAMYIAQAYVSTNGDASNVALSSPGLTVRGKPASFIRMQDAEPMYREGVYSDGQARSL